MSLFCSSQSAKDEPRADQKMLVQLSRGLISYFMKEKTHQKKEKKTARALRRLQDKRFGSHLTGVRKCKFLQMQHVEKVSSVKTKSSVSIRLPM